MMVLPLLAAVGAVVAGTRMLKKTSVHKSEEDSDEAMQKANQVKAVSLVSLGVASAGSLAKVPLLGIATLPVTLYVFAPALKHTWQKLREDRRLDDQALVTSRIVVYFACNYYFIAALDAALYASAKHYFLQDEKQFKSKLKQYALPLPMIEQMAGQSSEIQCVGERSSDRAIPWMLASFVLTLPMLGPNLAAAFLTTNFGGHLRKLGPHTNNRFMVEAIEKDIIVLQSRALEQLAQSDIILLDEFVLAGFSNRSDVRQWINRLREYYDGKLYVLCHKDRSESFDLMQTLGLEGYVEVPEQTQFIRQLRSGGDTVCMLEIGETQVTDHSLVLSIAEAKDGQGEQSHVHIQLPAAAALDKLPAVFNLAKSFTAKQQFNLRAPFVIDVVDISTTLLFDFGLVYSVLFTYSGLMAGAVNSGGAQRGDAAARLPPPPIVPERAGGEV